MDKMPHQSTAGLLTWPDCFENVHKAPKKHSLEKWFVILKSYIIYKENRQKRVGYFPMPQSIRAFKSFLRGGDLDCNEWVISGYIFFFVCSFFVK